MIKLVFEAVVAVVAILFLILMATLMACVIAGLIQEEIRAWKEGDDEMHG